VFSLPWTLPFSARLGIRTGTRSGNILWQTQSGRRRGLIPGVTATATGIYGLMGP